MIIEHNENVEPKYYVDISTVGSDTYDTTKGPKAYAEFVEWVENTDIPIIPNALYFPLKERMVYGRGIRHFMFWFLTEQDAQVFSDKWGKRYGMNEILDADGGVRYEARGVVRKVVSNDNGN